jgi:hypothetical protein
MIGAQDVIFDWQIAEAGRSMTGALRGLLP